jgi:hypothetical protein
MDPNGSVDLYYDGSKTFSTDVAGIKVYDDSGNDARIGFYTDAGVLQGRIQSVSTNMTFTDASSASLAIFKDGGACELYYAGTKTFETNAAGVVVKDSSGTQPILYFQDDAGTALGLIQHNATQQTMQLWNGSSYENVIRSTLNGAVELYYDNDVRFSTTSTGVAFGNQGTDNGQLVQSAADGDIELRNYYPGAALEFKVRNVADSAFESAIICEPDGTVELYYDGAKCIGTADGQIYLYYGGAVKSAIGHGATDNLTIYNTVLSGLVSITGEDSGSAYTTMATFDPDDAATLYYDGVKALGTDSGGIRVYDTDGDDPFIRFYNSGSGLEGQLNWTNGSLDIDAGRAGAGGDSVTLRA